MLKRMGNFLEFSPARFELLHFLNCILNCKLSFFQKPTEAALGMFLIAKIVRGRRLLQELEQQEKNEAAAAIETVQPISQVHMLLFSNVKIRWMRWMLTSRSATMTLCSWSC